MENVFRSIGAAILIVMGAIFLFSSWYIVPPGHRGVLVKLGQVDVDFKPEGLGFKSPYITTVEMMPVKQISRELDAMCFSQDLQTVKIKVRLLYAYPEANVVNLYRNYATNIFESILAPQVQEALKEVTALKTAEKIVKTRDEIKTHTLKGIRDKLKGLINIDDVVIVNIDLSAELEKAIELKMVQEQNAGRARFSQEQARIEAETAKIKAQGEADAIRIRSEALDKNPRIINLMIAEKWDGKAPLVVGAGQGTDIILPINK